MYFLAYRLGLLLTRLSAARAALIDNLDAAVSSRLAAASYTAPDNAGVSAIKAKTDNLPASPAVEGTSTAIKAKTDNLPASPANETTVAAIKAKTDNLPASPAAVGSAVRLDTNGKADVVSALRADATFDDGGITAGSLADYVVQKIWDALNTKLDATVSSRLASASYTAPDNSGISTLTSRLTAARASALDYVYGADATAGNINSISGMAKTLRDRLTSSRADYLDNLAGESLSNIRTDTQSLLSRLTATRAGYLDNLSGGAVALQSSVDDLESRLTSGRAANLDKLDANVSTASLGSSSLSVIANGGASDTYVDILNASGRGRIHRIATNTGNGFTTRIRITVDGGPARYAVVGGNGAYYYLLGLPSQTTDTGADINFGAADVPHECGIEFRSSIRIESATSMGSGFERTCRVWGQYYS